MRRRSSSSLTPGLPDERSAVLAREAAFHDALVADRDPASAPFDVPDMWEAAILEKVLPLEGLRVLDLGSGIGNLSVHLSDRGAASVTGLDVSPASVEFARRRLQRFRPEAPVEYVVGAGEATGLPDGAFDLIVGRFVLHHLDLRRAVPELHRLLRPGGRGAFIETSGLNPLAIAGRTHIVHRGRFGAVAVGTEDERPVSRQDLRLLRAWFPETAVDFPIFWLFRPFARQLLAHRYPQAGHWVQALDQRLPKRWPAIRRFSYHVRVVIAKPG
jgi:ubiquinone/menaquinone biosynthesis C-methylase UbiE